VTTPCARTPGTHGWQARLDLEFESRAGRSVLAGRRHTGPLLVQKPFYPEGEDCCHVYVVHPPAGVAGGDSLEVNITLSAGSHALVTTPGAAKYYRTSGPTASVRQNFTIASQATLEWMPQEAILHDGAVARAETLVTLEQGARFAGWEITCLGLPASDKPYSSGEFVQGLRIEREGYPLLLDRCRFTGGEGILKEAWGLGGETVCGIFAATLAEGFDCPSVLSGRTGCSVADGVLLARYIGNDAWEAKQDFTRIWKSWREATLGRPACQPRIWNT